MKRIASLTLLVFALVATSILGMRYALAEGGYEKAPIADPDTSDSYEDSLLRSLPDESSDIHISTREAGRMWADKTVTANDGKAATMALTMDTDGYDGSVSTTDPFLTTYSVLGSAINIYGEAQNPLDVVFLLDMSGSMGQDVYYGKTCDGTHDTLEERISHSRIAVTIDALNKAIDQVLETNESSRVGVVGYAGSAAEILPLAHYEKKDSQEYLTVDNFAPYTSSAEKTKDWPVTESSGYTVHANATKVTFAPDGTKQYSDYSSATRNTYRRLGKGNPTYIGFHTNLQVGIRLGFDQLYNAYQSADDVMWSYHSKVYGRDVNLRRIPMAFVMTDGGANYSLKDPSAPTAGNGNEYQTQPISEFEDSSEAYDKSLGFYRAELNGTSYKSQALILNNLLTASFMKSKVENRYAHFCEEANVLLADESADFIIHTVSVDTPTIDREIPRVYSSLDPENFFKPASELEQVGNVNPQDWKQIDDVDNAYKDWQKWLAAPLSSSITSDIYSCTTWSTIHAKINTLPEGGWTDGQGTVITKEDMERNIYYTDGFSDVGATDLSSIFTNEISRVGKLNTTPVSGNNDLGINGSATFTDPLGLHMDVHEVKSVLLFNKMHELTCQGIHDHAFIDAFNTHGAFKQGWYTTDDGSTAEYLGDTGHPENAFYFLDCDHAKALIPNIADAEDPKQKATRFVAYGIAEADASVWRINPAMLDWWNEGEYDPATLIPYNQDGHGNGIYRLSDIKVWTEDTGDYEDTGDVVVDAGYDRAIYVNVPAPAIPLQTVDVKLDTKEQVIYCETNLDEPTTTPLRVFYSVGLSKEVLDANGKFDYRKADPDYLAANTDDEGWVSFYSNYFSNSTWDHYGTGDPVSLGNAALTFSPSSADRYYVTQNALPLYKLVSYDGESIPKDSDWWDGIPCGAIEDNTTWDAVVTAAAIREHCTIERVTSNDQLSPEDWYFVLVDYYAGESEARIDHMFRLVPRQGKEFGSGVGGAGIRQGEYLCWTDVTCDHWEKWTQGSSPAHEGWTIGLRPGADRVGDLAQSKLAKGVDADGNTNNVTGTSENRMVPTISESSTGEDFIINTYMGNNGKLAVREYAYFTPEVKKVVENRDGEAIEDWDFTAEGKQFQFTLTPLEGAPAPVEATVTVGADGVARWSELTLERGKTYTYQVQEEAGSNTDINYETGVHTLTVSVDDYGTVSEEWDNAPLPETKEFYYISDGNHEFVSENGILKSINWNGVLIRINSITVDDDSVIFDYSKEELHPLSGAWGIGIQSGVPKPLEEMTLEAMKSEYHYDIIRKPPADAQYYVLLTADGTEFFDISVLYFKIITVPDLPTITNTYAPKVPWAPKVQKQMQNPAGEPISDWTFEPSQFSFQISSSDGPVPDPAVATTNETGLATWSEVMLECGRSYTYTVTENQGEIEGVIYDTEPKTLTVNVADDGTIIYEWNGKALSGTTTIEELYPDMEYDSGYLPPSPIEIQSSIVEDGMFSITADIGNAFALQFFTSDGRYEYLESGKSYPLSKIDISAMGDDWCADYGGLPADGDRYSKTVADFKEEFPEAKYGCIANYAWAADGPGVGYALIPLTLKHEIPTITNTYFQPVPFTPQVQKAVARRDGIAVDDFDFETNHFSFRLAAYEPSNSPMPTEAVAETDNTGLATWGEVSFTAPGTYEYMVTEETGSVADVEYDKQPHYLKVTVGNDGSIKENWDGKDLERTISVRNEGPALSSRLHNELENVHLEGDNIVFKHVYLGGGHAGDGQGLGLGPNILIPMGGSGCYPGNSMESILSNAKLNGNELSPIAGLDQEISIPLSDLDLSNWSDDWKLDLYAADSHRTVTSDDYSQSCQNADRYACLVFGYIAEGAGAWGAFVFDIDTAIPTITNYHYEPVQLPLTGAGGFQNIIRIGAIVSTTTFVGWFIYKKRQLRRLAGF